MNKKYSYNKNTDKTIWIDLDNSPHVPFFAPIIEKLQQEGYCVRVSARNYSQTVELAQLYGIDFTDIGKHHGKNKLIKIIGLIYRSLQLIPFVLKRKPTIAISHGSRSQMLVAHLFKIPIVIFLDYEFVQTIPFVKPRMMFFPNIISKERLSKFNFAVKTYPGIKEDIYVPGFKPDNSIVKQMGLRTNLITAIVRPPAHQAHYHNPESDLLFNEVMQLITDLNNVHAIILPRDNQQKIKIENTYKNQFDTGKFSIPTDVIDGLNLMWHSDLVISGGGTMNREASALGVPVYSIFKGKIGDVDKYLSQNGRLTLIETVEDVRYKINFEKRLKPNKPENINSLAFHSIVNDLENLINEISGDRTIHSVDENNEEILPFRKKHNTK
ncbi:MAG: DUF354 domain-containing protein [Ignavibacteriae bacterium]|nr:DUF354 domain-containing protein [Ignavibacteriota bacterium]MCB9211398.1 DUF354 domain-containing protein [Ignavibacteriales bacterium]MCB9219797.1 DUF354 domain-containing protein [Ignavibacteriales bacterium]